ncbi:PQQ-dependent sugar dehydrogenase [Porifericola rhodea]|uniref:PVC-type heme-binding CxxCH protein n=1 Tax=Porifericola rhodea TaxID=930972 RepID=UPI00266521AE|nr:PVC-type heme-binding CxxCH protein [Porifericola rhodea]WKN30092.1 PQQ-dependent sugar dehydrogenase [Porifericola rhodea]
MKLYQAAGLKKGMLRCFLGGYITALLCLSACGNGTEENVAVDYDALSDEEKRSATYALAGLEVADDLQATLFASEPMMINPTNMDIDARGRVWVCEGYNYRPRLNPNNPTKEEGDRILILEDTDGDGKADNSKVFYQGNDVNAALGIWVMGNKAIVSCSPHVLLLSDTDGDDKADQKEILFSGLEGEQHDHAIHAFVFGPDGKLYFNFGNAGSQLLDKNGNPVKEQSGIAVSAEGKPYREGMVFRCDPDGSNVEVLGHNFRNNYEVAVDAFGTLWQSDNDDDGNKGVRINYVMEYGNYGYKDEMTGENWRTYRTGMHDDIPLRHWHLNDPGVVPNVLQTGAGSPTGILVYEGELLPERFHNQMIHSDAGPNVVRAYPVEKNGAGYTAQIDNIIKGKDQWFRPSDVCVAPDGSLFVADWYDPGVGGHQMGDMDKGRIYRITPKAESKGFFQKLLGSKEKAYQPDVLDISTPEKAVEALKNPNLSRRYLAWQQLHDWGLKAEEALKIMAESENERYRARALWLLSKLPEKGLGYVEEALQDDKPDIRIAGIRMARQLNIDILPVLQQMVNDEAVSVRRELALALRYQNSKKADELWAQLAIKHDGKDRWYLEALGIGGDLYAEQRFAAWLEKVGEDWNSAAGKDIIWRMRSPETIEFLAELINSSESNTYTDRLRYFRAFDFHIALKKEEVLARLAVQEHPNQQEISMLALSHIATETVKSSPRLNKALRQSLSSIEGSQEYVELIRRYELKDYNDRLLALAIDKAEDNIGAESAKLLLNLGGEQAIASLLQKGNTREKQSVISVLKRVNNSEAHSILLGVIRGAEQPLSVREEAVMAFAGSWGGEERLLDALKSGDIHAELDSVTALVLSRSARRHIYEEAAALLDLPGASSEGELPPIKELVAMGGDASSGAAVFARACQNCHVVKGQGVDYGPALSEIGDKLPKDALYKSILNPSEGISFGYEGYVLKLNDGSTVSGYILSKSEDELQLRMYGGLTNSYKMEQIASIEEMEQSLMFDNLERAMSQQELVDLVEYLSSLKANTTASTK